MSVGRSVLGRGNGAGACLVCLRDSMEASMAGVG